ncbi:MAG TPA: amino acid adenylation domain-containing protein, partial [Chloroflexota bacterium]
MERDGTLASDMTVSQRIEQLSLEKRQLLEHLVRAAAGNNASRTLSPDQPAGLAGSPPLVSSAQRRTWALARGEQDASSHSVPLALRLRGPLDTRALNQALNWVLARHDALRTAFLEEDGKPRAVVVTGAQATIDEVALDYLAQREADATARSHSAHVSMSPMDLAHAPLLRAVLYRYAPDDHVFFVAFHHLVFDGWSLGIFVEELGTAYEAFARGSTPAVPPLPFQYADYAQWEALTLNETAVEELSQYWISQLDGAPPRLLFPACHEAEPEAAHASIGSLEHRIDAKYADVQRFCRLHGLTPFVVFLATLDVLLARLCLTEDVVVGTESAGRRLPEVEKLIGLFVNPVVLRTNLSGAPSFLEVCHRVRATISGALAHDGLPFDQVVQACKARSASGGHPLFNVVADYHHGSLAPLSFGNLVVEPILEGGQKDFRPTFDLVFHFVDTGEFVGGSIDYAPSVFSDDLIQSLRDSYQHLLHQGLANPQQSIAEFGLATPAWRERIVRDWGGQPGSAPAEPIFSLAHRIFEASCDRAPEHPALVYQDRQMSYAEVDRQANRLAHRLLAEGLGPDGVAICYLDRSPNLPVAMLATLKAGGAFCVLDPRQRSERQLRIVSAVHASVVVTTRSLSGDLAWGGAQVVFVDDESTLGGQSATRPDANVTPENLAYIIFTSGSTGEPKGVMCHHRGLANLAHAQIETFQLNPEDRILQASALSFDAFVWELMLAWGTGATLQLADWQEVIPGPEFVSLLQREHISVLTVPPSALAAAPPADVRDLRLLIVAGEACPAHLTSVWASGRRMVNAYGPTETTIWATYAECEQHCVPPIGRPIPTLQAYVLDERMEPVPPGFRGEICVGGRGVTRGYLHRPDLTSERFVPDPFASEPGGRLYRTGDVGSYLTDGRIVFEGRSDDQVKIRGFRVEPGEVERVLEAHPGVEQVSVRATRSPSGHLQLVAWYAGNAPTSELRRLAERRLPGYLRPTAYVPVATMPLTAHGKIDRSRLPDPSWTDAETGARFEEPRAGTVEATLAGVWADVLRVERVGRYDNFFELGGDSILAIQVVSRANQAGVALKIESLFEYSTLAELAEVVVPELPLPTAPAESDSGGEWYPLSPLQEGLLYHVLAAPGVPLYVQQFALELDGPLDQVALERAWHSLLERHTALRTSFAMDDSGAPRQRVHPSVAMPFRFEDWRNLSLDERLERWHAAKADDLRKGFDLANPPLMRCAVFQLEDSRHALLWTTHHLVTDGWSVSIIEQELSDLYIMHRDGSSDRLDPPAQFTDYLGWLGERDGDAARAYWREQLQGFDEPTLIAGSSRRSTGVTTEEVAADEAQIAGEQLAALQAYCRRHHLTLNTVFQAAWAFVLGEYTGGEDVVFGVTVSGRPADLPGVEQIVGPLVNTLPFRARLPRRDSLLEWLASLHRQSQQLQRFAYSSLVEAQAASAVPAGRPLFDTILAFQNFPGVDATPISELIVRAEPRPLQTGYPLTLIAEPGPTFHVRLVFDPRLISAERAHQLARHVRQALVTIPDAGDGPVANWSMLDAEERACRLDVWNPPPQQAADARLVHELVAAQAAASPHRVALLFEDQPISYGELNAEANRLAHWLQDIGVGPDTVVAIYAERSPELVVAALGTLKSGAAFLALSIDDPPARLERVLEQARPRIVLTQRRLEHRLSDLHV